MLFIALNGGGRGVAAERWWIVWVESEGRAEAWERNISPMFVSRQTEVRVGVFLTECRQTQGGEEQPHMGGEYELSRLDQRSQTTRSGEPRASLHQLC